MLHLIILILKIAGLLILAVLSLLLVLILLVLFVPVRYRIEGSYQRKPAGKVKVTWLLHILSIKAVYENELTVTVRIFGIRILKPRKTRKNIKNDLEDLLEDTVLTAQEIKPDQNNGSVEIETEIENENLYDMAKEKPPISDPVPAKEPDGGRAELRHKKPRFSVRKRLRKIVKKLKYIFKRICDTLKNIKVKKDSALAWIHDEENKKMVKLVFIQIKKMMRHILPRKARGSITFGLEDPYIVGQILSGFSLIYPFCHKSLTVYPVFDRQIFEGTGYFKGRIRLGILLLYAVRIYMNKNFRKLFKKLIG